MLGKLPYKHDDRTLKVADYLGKALPPAPPVVDWGRFVKTPWGMELNDQLGCCAIAAPGHMEMAWTAASGKPFVPQDPQILSAYEAVSGYTPSDPSTDAGCVVLDVLKYWSKTGIANHKISAYAAVNPSNMPEVLQAINLFGGLDLGFSLPAAAQKMGTHWTAPPAGVPAKRHRFWMFGDPDQTQHDSGLSGDWTPGSWGGHAVTALAFDQHAQTLTVVSWGELITVDYGFFAAYCDEAWAIVSPDLFNGKGLDQKGMRIDQLLADVKLLK
jgi:hypothetical protein